jgi:hypothetical protein
MAPIFSHVRELLIGDSSRPAPLYRYGMLFVCVALLLTQVWLVLHLPPSYPYDRYDGFIVPLMLLLNHLACAFRWSRPTTLILRIVAWVWLIFGLSYLVFHSD